MSLNPISKIIYHTPNQNPEAGLSEMFSKISSEFRDTLGKDNIELKTGSQCAEIEIVFKNGTTMIFNIAYARAIKHLLEGWTLAEIQGLSVKYI